jgi:hypothetical protein
MNGTSTRSAVTKQQTLSDIYSQKGSPSVKILKKLGGVEVLSSKTRGQAIVGVARRGRGPSGFPQRVK